MQFITTRSNNLARQVTRANLKLSGDEQRLFAKNEIQECDYMYNKNVEETWMPLNEMLPHLSVGVRISFTNIQYY
jgi:hypothetical protein